MKQNIDKITNELRTAAELEGSELGDYWTLLCELYASPDFSTTKSFLSSVEKEIISQYKFLKSNFKLETREEQYTRTVTELVEK